MQPINNEQSKTVSPLPKLKSLARTSIDILTIILIHQEVQRVVTMHQDWSRNRKHMVIPHSLHIAEKCQIGFDSFTNLGKKDYGHYKTIW